MKDEAAHETRLERALGVPLAEEAVGQWPQSGRNFAFVAFYDLCFAPRRIILLQAQGAMGIEKSFFEPPELPLAGN